MIKVKLNFGRYVKVEEFEFGYTYRGLLEGVPNERLNKQIWTRLLIH